ncbi:MAG: glycosyltransferase [Candidatus Hodarchaeota archaeon]
MKKEILFIIPDLKIGGGAGRVVASLTSHLSEKYKISILSFLYFKEQYSFKAKYYCLKENIGSRKKILKILKLNEILRPIRIYKYIKSISPDIIVSFMDHSNINAILSKIIFRFKIPLIVTTRCNPKIAYKNKKEFRHLNFLIKILFPLKSVDKIIAVSKEIEDILRADYNIDETKLITIYNGIDYEEIKKLANRKINRYKEIFYNEDIIKFITVGRLSEEKGYDDLIEIFYNVKTQISNSKLIIIGEGPFRKKIERIIDKKFLNNDVILLGLQRNPYKYMINSDIFLFSSKYEGFPNVLIEALACKLPIISTNCETGPMEILEKGRYGFLVEVQDYDDFKDRIIQLAKDQELMNTYSDLSFKRAKFFDLKIIINKWMSVIDRYLN